MAVDYSPKTITNGLIFCLDAGNIDSYPGTGTTWTDLVGAYSGTLTNSPIFNTTGGGSIVFDGIDDYVDFNQSVNSSQFTYEVFLRSTNISKDQMYVGTTIDAFYLRITGSRAFLSVSAGGQRTLSHTQTLLNNTNYHIVSIYNGVQLKIYVNNNLTLGPVINQTMTRWGGNRIGRWRDVDQRSFVGNIYSLKAYNRELSEVEILQNYNALKGRFNL